MKLPVLVVIFSIALSGCLPSLGGRSDKTEQGEFLKGGIVEDFPALPQYENVEIIESYTDRGNFGASFISKDDLENVVKFYQVALKQLGWETKVTQVNESNFKFDVKNAVHTGEVIVNTANDGKSTAISVFVNLR